MALALLLGLRTLELPGILEISYCVHTNSTRAFVCGELEEDCAELAARRIAAIERGSLLRGISQRLRGRA